MKESLKSLVILLSIVSLITSCSQKPITDDSAAADSSFDEFSSDSGTKPAQNDEFSDFDKQADNKDAKAEQAPQQAEQKTEPVQEQKAEQKPEEKVEQAQQQPPVAPETAPEQKEPEQKQPEQKQEVAQPTPPPVEQPIPVQPQVAPAPANPAVTISDLKYRAHQNGGTVVVEANSPFSYTTRLNHELNQFVIEIPDARIPSRLTRSLNTKDMEGVFGAIDAYQVDGANTARIVVQLRQGAPEPQVSLEGKSLLVMGTQEVAKKVKPEFDDSKALESDSLDDFLMNNNKFFGKKISLEMNDMDLRDALKFISDEAGVNMVIAEGVKGTVTVKLRQIPWDQALVVIMKAKKLGYTRQGTVLRIAPIADLRAEQEEATKVAASKRTVEPLKIRMLPVSFAKVEDLSKQVQPLLSERGKVVPDVRTSTLVVTDIEDNLNRIAKLITNLDSPPPQVLIEGKIVEASEGFDRRVGVNWSASGAAQKLGTGSNGPINMTPGINVNPQTQPGTAGFNISVGTFQFLGDLNASLDLYQNEDLVKIVSSPRILTLNNESAEIDQTTQIPIKQITLQNNQSVESITYKDVKLKLKVIPQITTDGSVLMGVDVSREFIGSVDAKGNASIYGRAANTKVMIKNGQTAVIGGIYQSDANESESGVPWFSKLPVIGYLFKSNTEHRQKTELLIFLTPKILNAAEGVGLPTAQSEKDGGTL